jgi:Cu(I)/Ag(I) efflux system membrane fusion protein/cobalt-zinc-cadmium efflux system membrane fusion protein
MKNYRNAFLIAFLGNLALIVVVAGLWWRFHRPAAEMQAAKQGVKVVESPESLAPPPSTQQAETPLAPVQLSPERLQSIGVKFGIVTRKSLQDEIRTTGTVAIDETRLSYVQTRIAGHIERVFADATYQYVRKGQPLFTLHSPELIAAEREYLLAKRNAKELSRSTVPGVASGVASLLDSTRDRMVQWNIPKSEIARLESTEEVVDALEIDSPVSGYIIERNALPNLMVQLDTRLYTVADLSVVWVLAQVFQNNLSRVHVGAPASLTVDSYPGRVFRGRVDFVYPEVDMTTRTSRVRLVFANSKLTLTPGMFVNVNLDVSLGEQLVIPASGVLQSGTRQVAFVDRGAGYLEPRQVQLGQRAGDEYIVQSGLKPGERIVTSANFLVDSESQLQAAIGSFVPPPPGAGEAAPVNGPTTQRETRIDFITDPSPAHKGSNLYRVQLKGLDGAPITGAEVSVRSYMPAMPEMGMAAMNVVTHLNERGNGTYEGQTKLETGGSWQITVTASKNGQSLVSKQLTLLAEGGMQP